MDEPPPDPLLAFAFGTFHAACLMVALVAALPGVLRALDTVSGLMLFAALWGCSVYAMRRAIVDKTPGGSLATRGATWGAAAGVLFLAAALVVLSLPEGVSLAILPIGAIGAVFAAGIGAFVGVAFVGIDGALAWVASKAGEK